MINTYLIRKQESGVWYFTSENGIIYHLLKFKTDRFDYQPKFKNKVYEFAFMANEEFISTKNILDFSVGKTIIGFVKKNLDKEPNKIIVYNCIDSDEKMQKRIKLFQRWFSSHADSGKYHLENFNSGKCHFAVLLSKKNKDFNLFIKEIHEWLEVQ